MTTAPDHGGTGPCPVSPCDWDLKGTLEDHLYGDHWTEDLAAALVRIALENDRLRADLAHEQKRVAYWQDSRASYAAENKRLIGEKKQLRAENDRLTNLLNGDDQPQLCPDCICGDCGGLERQHTPGGECTCGCNPPCERFLPDGLLDRIADGVTAVTGGPPLADVVAHAVWHVLRESQ